MYETPLDTALLIGRCSDQDVRLASYLLRKLGLHVLDSPDVGPAMRVLQEPHARVRIVILTEHQNLIGSSLERLRTVIPLSRVLVVTDGHQSDGSYYLERAPNVGTFITKPFRRAHFLGSVLSVMAEA